MFNFKQAIQSGYRRKPMCDFIPVLPVKLISSTIKMDRAVVQAQHITDKNLESLRSYTASLIIDNGVAEFGELNTKALYYACRELRPYSAICPFEANDADKTLKLFHAHATPLVNYVDNLMIIPQGDSIVEWVECLKTMQDTETWDTLPNITIGIPGGLDGIPFARRAVLAWIELYLKDLAPYMSYSTKVHLLGIGAGISEVAQLISYYPWIDSWSSVWPYSCAIGNQISAGNNLGTIISPEDWEPEYLPKTTYTNLQVNLALCDKVTKIATSEGATLHG